MLRFTAASNPPFLQLLINLDPKLKSASASHFTRVVIPNLYEKTKSKVEYSLSKADYLSDAWDLDVTIVHASQSLLTL